MSGYCVQKLPHKCGSSDGLQVFEEDGKYTGYCFSCNKYIADPYNGQPYTPTKVRLVKPEEEIAEEMAEIASLQTLDLPDRNLHKWALEYFGVKIGVSEEDGVTPAIHYYPFMQDNKIVNYKARVVEGKKFFRIGFKGETAPFGWYQALSASTNKLFITEGELDAVALFQALKEKSKGTQWEAVNPAVISVSNGSGSARKELLKYIQTIRSTFKEIILVFDMDEPGKLAVQSVLQILPAAKAAVLPEKDANECVMKGKSRALADSVLFRAAIPKNTRLVWAESLYEIAKEPAQWGLSWPWPQMTELTRGLRKGETIYLGAGVKMGKSTIVDALATHLMVEHDIKVMLAKPEEANKKTVKKILGYTSGHIFTDPKVKFDEDAYEYARSVIKNKFCVLDLYQHLDWQTLKQDIIAAVHEGVGAVFIDPITNLTNGIAAGEANSQLQGIAQDYSALAMDLNFIGFMFCHLLAPETGPTHERGGKVLSRQFAGSRAMARSCNYMIGLEGNKDPTLEIEQRNLRDLVLLEDREFGEVGIVKLYYDYTTGLFNEVRQ